MACRYYDDVLVAKLKKWIPEESKLRVLRPDETKRLYETKADDSGDKPIDLPIIALSRNKDIELELNIKNQKSFDGYTLGGPSADMTGIKSQAELDAALAAIPMKTAKINAIPIKLEYQLDIYAKKYEEADEYVRNFLFKLINNPSIKIGVPYNGNNLEYIANIRVLSTISDTSDISERIFSGQFTRWTIGLEIQDAQLFSVPYRQNWRLYVDADSVEPIDLKAMLEISDHIDLDGELEPLDFMFKKG